MARRRVLLASLAALLGAAGAYAAEPVKPAAAPTKAQLDIVAYRLKVLMSALQSNEVDPPIKNILFLCLYENSMQKISDATGKVIAGNKLDPNDANKVLTVMAGVCGLRPDSAAKAGPPPEKPSR